MAAGLRGAEDSALLFALAAVMAEPLREGQEVTNLLVACGLGRSPLLLPEVTRAAREGTLAGRRLTDLGRATALFALGRFDDPSAAPTLVAALEGEGDESRRAAALALGRLLRRGVLDEVRALPVRTALAKLLGSPGEPYVRGLAALALGHAGSADALTPLRRALRSDPLVRPYAAWGLGVLSRSLPEDDADEVHTLLANTLRRQREGERRLAAAHRNAVERPYPDARADETPNAWGVPRGLGRAMAASLATDELGSACTLALGLGRATKYAALLEERLRDAGLPWRARGVTAVALGLLGEATPGRRGLLKELLRTGSHEVLLDVALALGMLGDDTSEQVLRQVLRTVSLPQDNSLAAGVTDGAGRLRGAKAAALLALGRYGRPAAVDPLLAFLKDTSQPAILRTAAATGLGLLGDARDEDVFASLYDGADYGTALPLDELIQLAALTPADAAPPARRPAPKHTGRPPAPAPPR